MAVSLRSKAHVRDIRRMDVGENHGAVHPGSWRRAEAHQDEQLRQFHDVDGIGLAPDPAAAHAKSAAVTSWRILATAANRAAGGGGLRAARDRGRMAPRPPFAVERVGPTRIGYPELKPHDLRHGVAMEVYGEHHDLEQVRALLGHQV